MLTILKDGEVIMEIPTGGAVNLDGFHASPVEAGWEFEQDGVVYSAAEAPPPPEPEPPTPEEIRAAMPPLTARQLRLGLVGGGFSLSDVETTIDAIPDEQQRAVAQIEWQYAVQFERMHPLIEQVGSTLGLTPEQIDAMWEQALEL